jgi:hypothetical protein
LSSRFEQFFHCSAACIRLPRSGCWSKTSVPFHLALLPGASLPTGSPDRKLEWTVVRKLECTNGPIEFELLAGVRMKRQKRIPPVGREIRPASRNGHVGSSKLRRKGHLMLNRRTFLGMLASSAVAGACQPLAGGFGERTPQTVLVANCWHDINVGDIAHAPGLIGLIEKHLPEVEIILWPYPTPKGHRPARRPQRQHQTAHGLSCMKKTCARRKTLRR